LCSGKSKRKDEVNALKKIIGVILMFCYSVAIGTLSFLYVPISIRVAWSKLAHSGPTYFLVGVGLAVIYFVLGKPIRLIWKIFGITGDNTAKIFEVTIGCAAIAALPMTVMLCIDWLSKAVGGSFGGFVMVLCGLVCALTFAGGAIKDK
jgi:hypothetical protein